MKDAINNILSESIKLEEAHDSLRLNGFEVSEKRSGEDIEEFSDNVDWYEEIEVRKGNKYFDVYIEGNAIAEISYDTWVSSYNYIIDNFKIEEIQC